MSLPRWAYQLLFFVAVLVHFYIAYYLQRTDTVQVLGLFGILWLIFVVKWKSLKISVKQMIGLGMLLRLVYLLAVPELSDDVFRYLWDGMVTVNGTSPYALLPSAYLESGTAGFSELYPLMNSPDYYSIYPPVLQFIFGFSAWMGVDVNTAIVVLRVLALLAEFGSIILIWKLLKRWKMNQHNLMLYALNPLVIIEFVGSLHAEVFMVFFLLLSVWLLELSKETSMRLPRNPKSGFLAMTWLSAVAFGLAVGTKLLPLMFLPFYIKRLGWVKATFYGGIALGLTALLFTPFWTPDLLSNFTSSLRLYFANFEFNASIYYVIREVGFWVKGYNIIADTAVWLPRIVLVSILGLAIANKEKTISSLPKMMLFAWCIYYAFATTVNPWYITVLAAFLPFVKYRFALVWLMLIPLSYHAFGNADYQENLWFIALEYVPVFAWAGYELFFRRKTESLIR